MKKGQGKRMDTLQTDKVFTRKEYIERKAAISVIAKISNESDMPVDWHKGMSVAMSAVCRIPAADVVPVPDGGIGEMSDGYHTFNGLYYQRMVLFAALVKVYKGMAWKSWRHEDGELCFGKDNYFIVGIDTPQGSYTYHYHGQHWDLFDCEELPVAKHWDGHTEKDVTRLLSLDVRPVRHGRWVFNDELDDMFHCTVCDNVAVRNTFNYCPNCGARMDGDGE